MKMSPPALSSLLNTTTIAIAGANALRPLLFGPKRRQPARLSLPRAIVEATA
jgi:hypothetical protein